MSLLIFIKGFLAGASLIIAIGLQNAFILRQGLKNRHVFISAFIASLSDAVLIGAGILGFGALVEAWPEALEALKWLGAGFLVIYGLRSFRAALKTEALDSAQAQSMAREAGLRETILIVLGVTFLNPHVYLDTVVLLGSISTAYVGWGQYIFGIGAASASFVWFFSLAYGARLLAPLFKKPKAWQILDIIIGAVMWLIAFSLIYKDILNIIL
ncbi:MAG: LysE/ArgO family amino acid transporter [Alphaproteobacteria bacterium]|nr:LysE/ArgO family amino acid transporter [Alphaproteobacteria bacterium]